MPLIEYKPEMEDLIQLSLKIHTMRRNKDHVWYEGVLMEQCVGIDTEDFFVFREDICTGTQKVFMTLIQGRFEITVDDKYFYWEDKLKLAKNDGFETVEEMRDFFFPEGCDHDEWSGDIVHWTRMRY